MQPVILLYLSLIFSLVIIACLFDPKIKNRTLKCLCLFFFVVFLIHASVAWQQAPDGAVNDIFFASVLGMLQTFSLDADYQMILSAVSALVDAPWVRVYVQLILLIAPIIGGAAVLTIIMNIFPSVRYRVHLLFCRKLYIFSCLDESSLSIAQALIEKKRVGAWDMIVFANTSVKEENDTLNSLVYRAENMDAVTLCMKNPPEDLMVPAYVSVYYDFAKRDQTENINEALTLFTSRKSQLESCHGEVCLYIYAQPGIAVEVTEQMYACLDEEMRKKIYISVIPYVTNAIYKSLSEHPLHRDLGDPEEKEELTVAVIGDGLWAKELIKTAYWAGQYPNKSLRIVSFSKDAAVMEDCIHAAIPEWNAKGADFNYCDFLFCSFRQDSEEFKKELEGCGIWYIVKDKAEENMSLAEDLARRLNAMHLTDGKSGAVYCRVEDDALCTMANASSGSNLPFTIYGFGSIKDQYTPSFAEDDQLSFGWMSEGKWRDYFGQKEGYEDADYRNRSSKAAAAHIPAKMYALGLDHGGAKDGKYKKALLDSFSHFLADSRLRKTWATDIAVLEHRRWNAYIRSDGFCHADIEDWMDYYQSMDKKGISLPADSKDRKRGLHTCLLERDREKHDISTFLLGKEEVRTRNWSRIREKYREAEKARENGRLDQFDVVSICLYNMGRNNADKLKVYDTDSVDDLVSCYVVYDVVKRILSAMNGKEVRYSDLLKKDLGIFFSTRWLSSVVLDKLENENRQTLAYQLGEDVLDRFAANAKEFEEKRRNGEINTGRLSIGEYAKFLSKRN